MRFWKQTDRMFSWDNGIEKKNLQNSFTSSTFTCLSHYNPVSECTSKYRTFREWRSCCSRGLRTMTMRGRSEDGSWTRESKIITLHWKDVTHVSQHKSRGASQYKWRVTTETLSTKFLLKGHTPSEHRRVKYSGGSQAEFLCLSNIGGKMLAMRICVDGVNLLNP